MSATVRHPASEPISVEAPNTLAARIAARFDLPRPLEVHDFTAKGNINQHTFRLVAGPQRREFLLQRINHRVFVNPPSVMAAMLACLAAQRRGVAAGLAGDSPWEPIELVPTRAGEPYLEQVDRNGATWWRVMVMIGEAVSYKSLGEVAEPAERLRLAEEAGRGLALWGDLTADIPVGDLAPPLPGYRDTLVYFNQLQSVLAGHRTAAAAAELLPADPLTRASTEHHFLVHLPEADYRRRLDDPELADFIALALAEREFGLTLLEQMAAGVIRTVAIHGDTKLDNFLFDRATGRVKALVDLDTIMAHTWLVDWGDMVRSLTNVAGEKERELGRVTVDLAVYEALAKGFLETVRAATPAELDRLPEAVEVLALELGVRFLADYLRGDSYFRLEPADPPDLNKRRAMVQLTLLRQLRAARPAIREIVGRHRRGEGQ